MLGKYNISNGLRHQHWCHLWESHLRRCPHPQGAVQIKAVMEMSAPSSKKELQLLIDKLVALGSFIARFIDKL